MGLLTRLLNIWKLMWIWKGFSLPFQVSTGIICIFNFYKFFFKIKILLQLKKEGKVFVKSNSVPSSSFSIPRWKFSFFWSVEVKEKNFIRGWNLENHSYFLLLESIFSSKLTKTDKNHYLKIQTPSVHPLN